MLGEIAPKRIAIAHPEHAAACCHRDIDSTEIPLEQPGYVPATLTLLEPLHTFFRQQRTTFALVASEFALTDGIVMVDDLMLTLVTR